MPRAEKQYVSFLCNRFPLKKNKVGFQVMHILCDRISASLFFHQIVLIVPQKTGLTQPEHTLHISILHHYQPFCHIPNLVSISVTCYCTEYLQYIYNLFFLQTVRQFDICCWNGKRTENAFQKKAGRFDMLPFR